MSTRFVKLTENEDGTVSAEICIDGEEVINSIVDMSFEELLESYMAATEGILPDIEDKVVIIPDDAEGL